MSPAPAPDRRTGQEPGVVVNCRCCRSLPSGNARRSVPGSARGRTPRPRPSGSFHRKRPAWTRYTMAASTARSFARRLPPPCIGSPAGCASDIPHEEGRPQTPLPRRPRDRPSCTWRCAHRRRSDRSASWSPRPDCPLQVCATARPVVSRRAGSGEFAVAGDDPARLDHQVPYRPGHHRLRRGTGLHGHQVGRRTWPQAVGRQAEHPRSPVGRRG